MSVITGEGRVPILYGNQPMAVAPHRSGYIARPDAVAPHPAVVMYSGAPATAGMRTLARHLARHGYAVVVPPETRREFLAALDALGTAWPSWSRADRRAVLAIGAGAGEAVAAAAARHAPVVVLAPSGEVPGSHPAAALTIGAGTGPGRVVTYPGVGEGFWDDSSPDHDAAAAIDARTRIVGFLDRHLGA